MRTLSPHLAIDSLRRSWSSCALLEKELRVSSRHRRNYFLRFAYLLSLTVFVAVIWAEQVQRLRTGGVYSASRMAEVGRHITVYAVFFQFWTAQLIAVIMLSNAFSDEIYHRTLNVLMTTPVTNLQIVLGKLLSKLLQLLLLLAVTLPLQAIVRVFGGVPWDYIISSFCITVTAVLFVGSVTMLMSMLFRQPYTVIIATLLILSAVFGPTILLAMVGRSGRAFVVLAHLNPYIMLTVVNRELLMPAVAGRWPISWPVHCLVMLAASIALLGFCITLVRKVASLQVASRAGLFVRMWRLWSDRLARCRPDRKARTKIRRVTGPPVVWKELVCRISNRERLVAGIIIGTEVAMIVAIYFFLAVASVVGYTAAHTCYALVFIAIGLLFSAILPATCITTEKEAHSWPLLLTTTLSDWEILLGKVSGALRRCLPVWALLFGYVILFWYARCLHGIAIVHMALIVTEVLALVIAAGLYFSARCKRTSVSVIANLVLITGLWLAMAMLTRIPVGAFSARWGQWSQRSSCAIPFVQAGVVVDAATEVNTTIMSYDWPHDHLNAAASTRILLASTAAYLCTGLFFVVLAKRRLRRNVF